MSTPFHPATDIYADSDYAQRIIEQYQGNRYYVPGFNSGDSSTGFNENFGRGFFRYEDERSAPTALFATGLSLLTGKRAIPFNSRNLGTNFDVYESSRAYSQGRARQLQQAAFERANSLARKVAVQRNRFFGAEQEQRLANLFSTAASSITLTGMQAMMDPNTFEAMFGRAGSGMGMYDAAYAASTYRLQGNGSRWPPGERLRYASQATSMLYLDPMERRKRLLNSVEGGRLWTSLEAMGLLGGNDAIPFDQEPGETLQDAVAFFRENEPAPGTTDRTRNLHERVQKHQAINDRRKELSDLQDIINSPLDDDQKLEAVREFRHKSSELLKLEKDSNIVPHTGKETTPSDLAKVVSAMQELQAHSHRQNSYGTDKTEYDKETERLALIAQKELLDANIKASSGRSIDLANLGDDTTRQRIVSSLERAQGARQEYLQAEKQSHSALTDNVIARFADKYFQEAETRFANIVNDKDRDAGMANSRKFDTLLQKAQKLFDIQALQGSEEEILEARQKALEAAGGGKEAELVLQMVNRKLHGRSPDLCDDDPETTEIVKRLIQEERKTVQETARIKVDEELLKGGFKSGDLDQFDLSELPLGEIVSLSEAILAAQDDPRLAEWLRNSAMIGSKKGRWAEYEKAIKSLQESITDKNSSPAKLLETLNNFAGGNLHQMDVTQLKRTVQQTYALARQLGQGDEYVEDSMAQSQQMLATLGVNRAFSGWHGMRSLAQQTAALENPEYLGVWGAQSTAETTTAQSQQRAAWLASQSANQWGTALNLRETYGEFRKGSSAANYLKALEQGDTSFDYVDTDEQGQTRTKRMSVQMSDYQFHQMIPDSLDTTDPERIKAARSSVGSFLRNRSANQHEIFKHQSEAALVQQTQVAAQFVNTVAGTARAVTARSFINQQASRELEKQGISDTDRNRILQKVYKTMANEFLDSDQVERVLREQGIERDDTYLAGKVGVILQKEEFERILRTEPADSEAVQVAQVYLDLMQNSKDQAEMAVPVQELLDEIGLKTGHKDAINAAKELSRKNSAREQVHIAVASEESRQKEAYTEGFSHDMLTRIADSLGEGATFGEMVNAALQLVDLEPDSDLIQAHRDFSNANAKVRELEIERGKIIRNKNLSDEQRTDRLAQNDRLKETAVQNLGDAQATLQPLLREMRIGLEQMSTVEFDSKFGMDLDLLNQVATVEDSTSGQFRLRKLKKGEVRVDTEMGLVQVREGDTWVNKQDAAYFAQLSHKNEQGEEEHYFKELFRENNTWKYRDDDGSLRQFDPKADGSKLAVGTRILTRAQDGSIKASNLHWTNGFLTRTGEEGNTTNVVTDSEGNFITMDSQLGQAIYSSSEDGFLNPDILRAIETNNANLVTALDSKTLKQGAAARRRAAVDTDDSTVSQHEENIRTLANQYVDSTGAIGEIEPYKVEMDGETFYMLSGYGNEKTRRQEWEQYRQEKKKQESDLTAYFDAPDSEARHFLFDEKEQLQEVRRAYRLNQQTQERLEGRRTAWQTKLKTATTDQEKQKIHQEIAKSELERSLLEPVGKSLLENTAREQAQEVRIDKQSEMVRSISQEATSVVIDDPNLWKTLEEYAGINVAEQPNSSDDRTLTTVVLSGAIDRLKETVRRTPLSATELGILDTQIADLTRMKEEAQTKTVRILREKFQEQSNAETGIKIIDGKVASPVKTDRFGDPVVVTPVPRKDSFSSSKITEPTDIRQVRIGAGIYDAVTGQELNLPVRPTEKSEWKPQPVHESVSHTTEEIPNTPEVAMVEDDITRLSLPPEAPVPESVPLEVPRRTVKTSDTPDIENESTIPLLSHAGKREDDLQYKTLRKRKSPFQETSDIPLENLRRKPIHLTSDIDLTVGPPEDQILEMEKTITSVPEELETNIPPKGIDKNFPAMTRTSDAVNAIEKKAGTLENVQECTIQADTVHFKVDSMDMKNGSVIVEAVGRSYRSGTSEQR